MQLLAFKNIPFYPTGEWSTPTAYRKTIKDIVRGGLFVFWGVKPPDRRPALRLPPAGSQARRRFALRPMVRCS